MEAYGKFFLEGDFWHDLKNNQQWNLFQITVSLEKFQLEFSTINFLGEISAGRHCLRDFPGGWGILLERNFQWRDFPMVGGILHEDESNFLAKFEK